MRSMLFRESPDFNAGFAVNALQIETIRAPKTNRDSTRMPRLPEGRAPAATGSAAFTPLQRPPRYDQTSCHRVRMPAVS